MVDVLAEAQCPAGSGPENEAVIGHISQHGERLEGIHRHGAARYDVERVDRGACIHEHIRAARNRDLILVSGVVLRDDRGGPVGRRIPVVIDGAAERAGNDRGVKRGILTGKQQRGGQW